MKNLNQQGFTITELVMATFMAGIVAVLIGGISIGFYGAVLRGEAQARMVVDSQIILRKLVDELRISSAVSATNSITDSYGPGGGWNTSSDNAILIIETPVIADNGEFLIDDSTGTPFYNELVYFAEGDNMFRRTLINPLVTENNRLASCPSANVGTGGCEVPDGNLSTDYQDMLFTFYDQDNAITADTSLARSIDMTINLGRVIFGGEVDVDNNIRVTLRNNF